MEETQAFHFGPPGRRLFGLYQPAAGTSTGRAALLCSPFGQEAVRGHRVYRVLAERLVRSGIAVLRFDYHGTGDSAGDDDSVDLAGCVADTEAACIELAARSGAGQLVGMGARLGATVLAMSAARLARRVLWDPIIDGQAYVSAWRLKHVEALESSYSLHDPAWRRDLNDPAAYLDEASGFATSARLRSQIAEVSPRSLRPAHAADTHVIAQPDDPVTDAWLRSLQTDGVSVTHWPLAHAFDWTTGEAFNTALAPAAALNRLLASLNV